MARGWFAPLFVALALGTLAPTTAAAPPEDGSEVDLDTLRKRFKEGIELESKQKWAEALTVFEEVAKAKSSPQVRFHVALCHENLNRLREAKTGFEQALKLAEADPDSAKDVLDSAPGRIAALEARIPVLVIEVSDGGEAVVAVGALELGTIKARAQTTLDPGAHDVTVKEGGKTRKLRTISVAEGERLEIKVPAAPKAAPEVVAPPPPETTTTVIAGTKVPFFAVGAVGLASLAGAGVMIGLRQAAIGEVRDSCGGDDTGCDPALVEVAERGQRYEHAAWGLGAAGLACLGAATVLFFTVGQDEVVTTTKKPAAARVRLGVGPSGLSISGTFTGP
jgi:hypothetical protein